MTLLEAGLERSAGRRRPKCIVAKAISKLTPELQAEAIELLQHPEVGGTAKEEVLFGVGIQVVSQTISYKTRLGCGCDFCHENGVWPVTKKSIK